MESIMSFSPIGSTAPYQPNALSLSFDLEMMLKNARAFTNGDGQIYEYIKNILTSSAFQSNPKGFLADWSERRGYTEEFRYPEDRARIFFDKNFGF